jgi:Skp family chaperone for outer membrane proteins
MPVNKLLLVPALLLAALAANPAFADDTAGTRAEKREQWCKDNPAKCEEAKARRDAFCKNNPTTCEHRREEREEMKAECDKDPAKCEKLKEERKARHARMHEACKANPAECEKRRAEHRERREERSEKFCAEHPDKCDGKPD